MVQKKPNRRNHRVLFYRRSIRNLDGSGNTTVQTDPFLPGTDAVTETDDYGEAVENYILVAPSFCGIAKASKPIEVVDGGVTQNQTQYFLDSAWTKTLSQVDSSCIAADFHNRKIYEVVGNAVDPFGDRQSINIYVVDNITRLIDIDSLPREFPLV
jgi:hypothetical protein